MTLKFMLGSVGWMDGQAAKATANPFDSKYKTYEGLPPSSQYYYKFCNADVNQGL